MNSPSNWHVCVLVPAHNEEKLLPRCLDSIKTCIKTTHKSSTSVDVVVAVDSSTDHSFELAKTILKNHGVVIRTSAENVGRTRRMAAEVALARYHGPLNRCWLANTDADSSVPHDWLAQQLDFANSGVEALAGIVNVDNFEDHQAAVQSRFRSSYKIFSDGTHPHVHGANLGIRADVYLKAGGWNDRKTAEDWDLWRRLEAAGAKRKSSACVIVSTSGRKIGRAPHGFAEALAAHNS